jgi:hypothetical protein
VAIDLVPELVSMHVWGVGGRQVPACVAAMLLDRRAVSRSAGLTFHKLLGTGTGATFSPRDADLRHWALLACWADERALAAFERSAVLRRWDERTLATGGERLRVVMTPLSSRGSWQGRRPFGDPVPVGHHHHEARRATRDDPGVVAAVTRARLRPSKAATFWRAVPPVSARLREAPGLLLSLGIGEAPVGLQGTFSVWESAQALEAFAYGTPEHRDAVARTATVGWYVEELFARLSVIEAAGSLVGRRLDVVA